MESPKTHGNERVTEKVAIGWEGIKTNGILAAADVAKRRTADKFSILRHNLVFEGNLQIRPIMFHYGPDLFMRASRLSVKRPNPMHAQTQTSFASPSLELICIQ